MSGTPNWNPRLQTSSVRFPRKAVETPQIPPNTTARPMPGAPFQAVYPNPITQIPTITATANPSNPRPVFNQLYTLSAGFGEVITYPGRRGVPTPTVILQKTNERYLVFGVNFPYQMSGTDHFVFTFTSQNTGEQTNKNFQPAPQYIVGGLLPGVLYTLTVAPVVNGITYPGSAPPLGPLTISAVSEKNVQLQGVTLSGGDNTGFIQWINATPQPPIAFEVTTVAVDDNFGTPQRLLKVNATYPKPTNGQRPTDYSGYVQITNLNNGSAYTFTITPYQETDGIFEYGRPTTLPPYIPGPPGDLVITGISSDGSANSVTLNVTYDTTVHPVPEATKISIYKSTFTTLCSLVGQSTTVVQDLSQTYASFTTSTGFFTPQGFASIVSSVSSAPGSIQVDLLNDKGYFYTFPLTDVSTGELGYTFGNSNFVKTTNLISTASSYSVLFRSVSLGDSLTPYVSGIGQTVLTLTSLPLGLCTFVGSNFANGLSSRVSTYTTIAVGKTDQPQNITGIPGNQFVSLAFSGYNLSGTFPRPISYLYTETGSGKTYTSITSNILIGGLVNGSAYTFGIQGFGNGVYGPSGQFSVTPAPQPPTNLSASISNYDVTISFAAGLGGADFYQITNQSGQTIGLSGGLYKFLNLSADVGYTFRGKSFVYGSPVYTLSSIDPSTSIVEISSTYAQFLVSPSVATISYASTMITNIQYFVPYNYTISGGGTTYSFPITSMTPVYDASGATLLYYNIANTNISKAVSTFSGAVTSYTTSLSTTVPLFAGMVPTTSSGTISSVFSLPTSPSAYVGPPTLLQVTASLASSQRVDISVQSFGLVVPTRYNYTEVSGKIAPGFSLSTNIVIDNLTNGSSYTFTISAFGNQVYSTTGVSAGPFLLSTSAPSNAVANFSNTTATVTFCGYTGTGTTITYFGEIIENGYPGTVKQTLSQTYSPFTFSSDGINAGTNYGFRVYGVQSGISSANEIVNPIIAGPPRTPKNIVSTLSQNQITFNWSTGDAAYNETYTITEYLSNNGVCNATGLVKSGISSQTYTISSVITASGTQVYDYGSWLETTPGYASFVLQNVTNFTDVPIGSKYSSNQIYLTLQQSGLTYTFPLSTVTPFGTESNTYANTKYPKDPGNIFNPLLSLSVTYSYGTGPRNGGTYSYAFTSFANQVESTSSNVGINMFVQPVLGIPSVSVSGTSATISFAQTNPPGTVYRVTNNYGTTVSRAPYTFANLSVGTSFPYTFSVVAANGVFVSVSSELSPPVYVGPPPIPLVGASYFGQVASVTAIDTTISLTTVFYDTGTQNTGSNVWTVSHGNVIQTGSGGFWVATLPTGYNGGSIKDSAIGFVATTASSYAMYSNDGYSNARYQFTVSPSTGTITATLSAYSLIISGSSVAVTNSGLQVYSGTTLSPSYTVQFFSYSNGFGIQSGEGGGNNLLYYSQVPAGSDSLVFTITNPASFSNFQASRIQNVGPATVSYGIVDQFNTVYNPSLQFATYTPSGLQYTYSIFNIPYAITLNLSITPFANQVSGDTASVNIFLYTGSPGTPQVSILNTTATITVPKVAIGSVDTYFLDIITDGATISTLSAVATASPTYIFQYPGLIPHSNYFFSTYAKYNGNPTTTGPVKVGPYEAGKPYSNTDFPGLVTGSAAIGNPNATTGTYTISALVNPGKNSNAAITTSVYTGTTFVTSQTINTSQQQVFSFTVSSGAVYALSTTAFMNGFTANSGNPSITLSANPFPPRAVALTISSANRGQTYGGAITITASSATPTVSNVYGYTKNGISTDIILGGNTFIASYNSSYTGYAYTTAAGGTLSSSIIYSAVCNVSLSAPTNVQVDYNSTNITLTWSGATDGLTNFYTVTTSSTTTTTNTISENIPWEASKTYLFTGDIGNNYIFTVQGQSQRNPSASLIYSLPISASVSLSTGSVNPSAYYSGATITVSFGITNLTTFSSLYTFGVTCVCGSVTSPSTYSENKTSYQSPYTYNASVLGQILRFAVQPLLKGILGPVAYTNTINLTTSALTNIAQSYTGTTYTISWTPITTPPGYIYVIRDVCDSVTQQTIQTSASSSTQFTLSSGTSYQFQAYAIYNGIQSVSSTLSRIYTYTNPVSGAPTTSYNGTSIQINWSAATQADGNLATSYLIENIYYSTLSPTTICSAFVGTSYSYTGTKGSDYTFAITAKYNGFDASIRAVGEHIGLYTNPPTNVRVTNSGQNILVTWSGSSWPPASQATIFYTLSQIGNGTLTAGSDGSGRFTTSATVYAPNTSLPISSTAFYNYLITASAKGFTSSPFASATVSGLVFTYAPTDVVFTYSGLDTRTSPAITSTQTINKTISPKVSWTNTSVQSSTAVYTVSLVDISVPSKSPTDTVRTQAGINYWTNPSILSPTINLATSNYGDSIVPYVYATNNGLASETVSGSPVRVYTAPPGVVGVGFDGLYRITFSLCRGATNDIPDYFTIWERNDAYKTNTQSGDYPLSYFTVSAADGNNNTRTVYTIPLTGIQGYTYNFGIYASRFGVASELNTTLSAYKLETTPVTDTSTAVSYSGTIITFSWSEALQQVFDGTTAAPNVGYTIYVTPGNPFIPLVNAYKPKLTYNFAGIPGQSYYFTIEAVNNNITSPPTQSAIVTLYQPVVTNLAATNTCENDRDVSMILTWSPDILNASGAQYRAVSFNQSTGATVTSNDIGQNSSTVTFTGSIGVAYTFFVQGIYKGISGFAQSVQISNARPRITSFTLTNLGNNIFAQYTVTPIDSIVTLSTYNNTSGSSVTSISYTSATTATITVLSAVDPGIVYSISATARYFGIPSTVCGKTYTMIQPAKPTSFGAGYNNALVSVSWTAATNASSYTFIAYDLSTNRQADIQSYIPQTFTTFIGTLGSSYSLSVTAYSATYIPSVTASTSVAILIPNPPTGLSLCNAGALVTVTWNADPSAYSRYSYTVVNASSTGTIFYQSSPYVNSGDTFLATVGQTFRVNLFGTSLCNVTSVSSTSNSIFIYQPSIASVTATSVGADITLTFPGDARETCEYLVVDNYNYSNLLYSPSGFSSDKYTQTISAKYTESANGYISYTILNNSYNLNGTQYQYTVTPYYKLVPGTPVLTSGVNPLTLYKPTTPGQFTVRNQGSDLLLNWQSSAIGTIPVPTLVPNYRVDVNQVFSTFTSTTISGLQLWLDGSDPSGSGVKPTDGYVVTTWKDKSGKGRDGSAPGTQRATYSLSSNGLIFTGSQAYSTTISSSISAQTGFAVVSYNTTNKINIISVNRTSGTTPGIQQIINNNVLQLQPYGSSSANVSGGTGTQNTPFIYDYTFSTVCGSSIYANGTNTATSSTAVTLTGSGTINIGGYNNTSDAFSGTMFEVMLYDSILSTGQRQQVEGYLARKWGLVNKLPDTHPYGPWPDAKSPQYITGTTTTFTGYNSDAGQLSISVTAIIPGYDQNLSANYINGFTSNKNFTIPNQTNISIKQDDPANPQVLSVRIPPLSAAWVWFLTTAYGTAVSPRGPYYTCNINTDPTQSLFQTYKVTVSTGLYYTVSAYGWFNDVDFPKTNPGTAPVIINANPNPYPATTFNVSYGTIKTSHSGTTITVSWAPVTQASYYDIQEFNSANVQIGGGGILLNSPSWVSTVTHTAGSSYKFQITAFTISQANFNGISLNPGIVIDGLPVGANLPNSKNPYFPSPISSDETLYIPGSVVNLSAVQFLQTVSLTWLQPISWTPNASITTTAADTTYFIQQLSGTTTTVVDSKTISGGGGTLQTSFNISAGRTYTFTVSTTYYGIQTTTPASTTLATVNPSITALTLTDNGNKTATLAGTANTAGDWFAFIGSPVLWLDGADPAGNGTFPSTITTWVDKSGLGNNATSGTGSGALTVTTAGVSFNGTTNFLNVPGIAGTLANTPFVVIAVEAFNGNYATKGFYFGDGVGGSAADSAMAIGYRQSGSPSGPGAYTMAFWSDDINDTNFNTSSPLNVRRLWANYLPSATNRTIRLNGSVEKTHTNFNRLSSFTTPVVGRGEASGNFYTGVLSEILVFNTDIGLAAIQEIEYYLSQKWGITGPSLPSTPTTANSTTFTTTTGAQAAGTNVIGFVDFRATTGGLTTVSVAKAITFANPAITTCSISDNFTDGTLTLNLVASIGGSGTYTPRWTVPATVGTLTLTTSPANSASTTAVYKKALAAQTYSFTGITVSADGFQSSASSASYTTPTFTVSQNPALIIITNPKTLSATFFSPELTVPPPVITCNVISATSMGSFTLTEPAINAVFTVAGAGGGSGVASGDNPPQTSGATQAGSGGGSASGFGAAGGLVQFTSGLLPAGTVITWRVGSGGGYGRPRGSGGSPDGANGSVITAPGAGPGGGGGGSSGITVSQPDGTTFTLTAGGGGGGAGGGAFLSLGAGNGGTGGGGSGIGGSSGIATTTTGGAGGVGSGTGPPGSSVTPGQGSSLNNNGTGKTGSINFTLNGLIPTISTSLTLSSTISWNFPNPLTGGGTLVSYAPSTGSGIVDVTYRDVPAGVTATFPANSVSMNYKGYTGSLGSIVSYATPNPTVYVNSTDGTRFVDNHDRTLTLFLVATGCTQGSGNVTWTVPSSVNGNGTAPDALTVSGSPTTLSSTSVVYTGAKNGSTYTINAGGVSVAYSGYSNSNATSISSPAVALPQVTAITGVYFGCSEDKAITGADSITVSISSDLASSWTITACSALTQTSSSGQGTRAVQWLFSGGLKTRAYNFTVGSCNVTVSLTKPSANVTPSFSSFVGSPAITGVKTSIANGSGSTFVFFGATNATDTATTITLDTQSTLTTGIFTVSAAAISNGILGTISSYQFLLPFTPTIGPWGSIGGLNDNLLSTSNTITITFTPGGTGPQVCALVSGNVAPSVCSATAPAGETSLQGTFTGGTPASFTVTLDTAGSKNFYVIGKSTTASGAFYSPGSSLVSFTYNKNESILSGTSAGSTVPFRYTGGTGKSLLYATVTSGTGGGAAPGRGRTFTVTGWRNLDANNIITLTPASDGGGQLSPGSGFTNGGKGGAACSFGGFGDAVGYSGFAGGGAARLLVESSVGLTKFDAKIPGGGGRGGDANGGDGSHNWKAGGGGGGGGTNGGGGNGIGGGFDSGQYPNGGAGGSGAGGSYYLRGFGGKGGMGAFAPNSAGGFGGDAGSNAEEILFTNFDNTMSDAVATVGAGYSIKLYWIST